MHSRYEHKEIKQLFSDENKLQGWQKVELAVLEAKVNLNLVPPSAFLQIKKLLENNPIDLAWWKSRDQEIGHDLNAFIDERTRFLPSELHQFFHEKMTSYDTEESPFIKILEEGLFLTANEYLILQDIMHEMIGKYRYTIMMGRTHGQEAELQTFGKRIITWFNECEEAYGKIMSASETLNYSKLSGAIGNYGGLGPDIEEETLKILKLRPYYGATQIMPRSLYAPLAQAIGNLVLVLNKIALDIRLAARSGRPLMREPFGKKQKGSSAMPQKKNPIGLEQVEGLARLAKSYMLALTENIVTWEERAIEQSCVERVAWPDLFHVVNRALTVMQKVLKNLTVYQDNMLEEILDSRGTYASSEVKEFLKKHLAKSGLSHDNIYRLVQLACFNVFEPTLGRLTVRNSVPKSLEESLANLEIISGLPPEAMSRYSIKQVIQFGDLRVSEQLDISEEQVDEFNQLLSVLFEKPGDPQIIEEWYKIFTPDYLLRNEKVLYENFLID